MGSFIPSDFRDSRGKWLSKLFVQDNSSRVKCSEVLTELTSAFEGISKRECGFVVRKRFPNVKRIHSNHVYYYTGIRRLTTAENLHPDSTGQVDKQSSSSSDVIQEIPSSLHINRMELLPDEQKKAVYNFSNGNFSHLELRHYRGLPVAVRQYETSIVNEARTVLSLPSHPCFPVLIGVCCDVKPYLLVTMFYGHVRKRVYMSVRGLLESNRVDIVQWILILLDIAEGLFLMHSCGFVHGDLKAENIILRKEKARSHVLSAVFLNLEKAKALDRDLHGSVYQQDFNMFGSLIDTIIAAYSFKDAANLSGLNATSQLVKMIPGDGDLSEVVTHLQTMLSK